MGPVEWTRLEGGQVEAVVAMFVNREHPSSVRITPSRGDGGVDILDRGAGPDGSDIVYQVKRYTDKVTSRQKAEIKNSLETVSSDKRWSGLTVTQWHLVTPWDPSPEAETWLQGLGDPSIRKIWHGLTWTDQQAAKYDDVVDYYLHGGRALIEKTYAEVMSLLAAPKVTEGLTVPEVAQRLQDAVKALGHDPHYRYELRLGEGTPPPPPKNGERPGLVMQCLTAEKGGSWITVDIIARCAASTDERPITVQGTFKAEPDSAFAHQLDAFATYGAPFTSPAGAFDGVIDAPGGLGGPLTSATVKLGPTDDQGLGANQDMHLEVIDPNNATLAAVDIHRVERSQGVRGGIRAVLEEVHGLFTLEDRYDLENNHGRRSLSFGQVTGQPVNVAYKAIKVLSEMRAPNKLRLSVRHTAPKRGVVDPNVGFDWDTDTLDYLAALSRALETLAYLQEHASEAILAPDFAAVPHEQFGTWRRTAALLRGEEITTTYPEGGCLMIDFATDITLAEGEDLAVQLPLSVQVGEQVVALGHQLMTLPNAALVDRQQGPDSIFHRFTTADRTVRWTHYDPQTTE